jgi:hypothetical protein
MDHPDGLAPFFRGDTWTAWRAFLAALFALPMNDEQLALYRQHTGRQLAPTARQTEVACCVGRRGGKSRVLALIATYLATFRDYSEFLAPGEIATIAILASDRKQSRNILRYVLGMLEAVPSMRSQMGKATDEVIPLPGMRVQIEITTASFRATRGYTYAAVLADEVAFWRSEESANPDEEILAAIRPGLATIPGSMLLLASSPYAKRGALYKTFRRHFGQDGARVLVWKASTSEMNPGIDPAIIAEAYEDDPVSAASEYGAEFRDDIAAFVAREVIDAAVAPGRFEIAPLPGTKYVAFVDPSGGSADSFTLAIAHKAEDRAVLDALREVRPPFSPEGTVIEFATILKSYGITKVTGDRFGGEFPRELFRKQGIEYLLSERVKSDIYKETLPLLNSGRVELLEIPRLITQFCGLERRTARGGRDSIDHAPGSHDDAVNAVAGVLLLALSGRGPMVISSAALERSRQIGPRFAGARQFRAYGGAR